MQFDELPSGIFIPQTAKTAAIQRRDSTHPADGLTPSRMAEILKNSESGELADIADLYADMEERDGHLLSEIVKRRRRVTARDFTVRAKPGRDEAMANRVEQVLRAIPNWNAALFDLTDAIGKGISALEIQWHHVDGVWLPQQLHARPLSMLRIRRAFDPAGRNWSDEVRLNDGSAEGARLATFGWLVHKSAARTGDLTQSALYRACAWPYLYRRFSLGDWLEFLEVYGYPIRIGTYGRDMSKDDRRALLRAVTDLGRRAGGIVPEGSKIDVMAATTGDPEAFSRLVEWCDKTQSKLINGGTLTSQADGKSSTNALGNVHSEEANRLTIADPKALDETITRQLILPIMLLNGWASGPMDACEYVTDTQEPEDLSLYADALPKLVAVGMQIPARYVQERLRIPMPEPNEHVLRTPVAPETPGSGLGALGGLQGYLPGSTARLNLFNSRLTAASRGGFAADFANVPAEQSSGALVDWVSDGGESVFEGWINTLRSIVAAAGSMEAARDGFLNAFGDLPSNQLVQVMEAGFALAALKGMVDVEKGN